MSMLVGFTFMCNVLYFYLHCFLPVALHPSDITAFFEPIFEQAKELRKAYSRFSAQTKVPFITVSSEICAELD